MGKREITRNLKREVELKIVHLEKKKIQEGREIAFGAKQLEQDRKQERVYPIEEGMNKTGIKK